MVQHHCIYLGYNQGVDWFVENNQQLGVQVISGEQLFNKVDQISKIIKFQPHPGYTRSDLVYYANKQIGRSYDLINNNCEHFANEIQHRKKESQQATVGIGLAFLLVIGLVVSLK